MSNDIWTAPKAVDLGVKDFLVLKPGKSVTLKRPLTLLTPIDTARTIKGSVQKGSHVFALSLHDWPYDESETALLSKVVSKLGRLWLKGLISIPSPIEI